MNTKRFIAAVGVLTIMSTDISEAVDLNEDQQTAKTIFENNLLDAREKLQELKTDSPHLDWKWYQEWVTEPLKRSAADAQKAGVPASTPIGYNDPIPFSKAIDEAARIEGDIKFAFGMNKDPMWKFRNGQTPENLKRYEVFRAQFAKGLSGDKLRIMDEILITAVVYAQDPPKFFIGYYGEGKKLLTRPEQFASSRIWATSDHVYASDDTLKRDPHWRITVHHFDGMKLVHTTNERGSGTEAPIGLYAYRAR